MKDEVSGLKSLGSNTTEYKYDKPGAHILETFPNKAVKNNYTVTLTFPEFTSLCPRTGQPDFGKIKIVYTPDKDCIESKSLKLYLFSWRNEGCFMETITNQILDHIVEACDPLFCKVIGTFNARGGITIRVKAMHHSDKFYGDDNASTEAHA